MKGASFEQKTFKTLSNIGLEVEWTPWVGILWPMTPCHVTKVIQVMEGHQQFFGNNFWRPARAMKTP